MGATEAAPATGTAELIVDITTTGATLAANGLKVIEDGIILRSEANLIAARGATWGTAGARDGALVLDRIASQARAGGLPRGAHALPGMQRCAAPRGTRALWRRRPARRADVLRHADSALSAGAVLHALASFLRDKGATAVTVTGLDVVFARENPLYARLEDGLRAELPSRIPAIRRRG